MITYVAIILGVVVTLGTSFLKDVNWTDKQKTSVAVALSTIVGGAAVFLQGDVDPKDLLGVVTTVFASSHAFYKFIFADSTFNTILENSGVGAGKAVSDDTFEGLGEEL